MLSKESKIRVLENYYSIDYVLFGKPVSEAKSCCQEVIKDFINTKAALLSTMTEMQKLVKHVPKVINEKVDVKGIMKMSRSSAKIARQNCQRLVVTEAGKKEIKINVEKIIKEFSDTNVNEAVKNEIRKKSYTLAIDNLLLARMISESIAYKNLNEWEGKILEDSYKILRDELVESAIVILDLLDENTEYVSEVFGVKKSFTDNIEMLIGSSNVKKIISNNNTCVKKCNVKGTVSEQKKHCELKCKVATNKEFISAIKGSNCKNKVNVKGNSVEEKDCKDMKNWTIAELTNEIKSLEKKIQKAES